MIYYKNFMLENNYVCLYVNILQKFESTHIKRSNQLWLSLSQRIMSEFGHCDFLFSKFFELACMISVLVLKIHISDKNSRQLSSPQNCILRGHTLWSVNTSLLLDRSHLFFRQHLSLDCPALLAMAMSEIRLEKPFGRFCLHIN